MSYFMQFWPILGPYGPLTDPLHYHRSMLKGSYSPKIIHKIVLPENGFISIFFEVKMTEKCKNVIFHAILTNFETIWPIQKPRTLPTKYVKGLIFSQKSSTTRKWINFHLFEVKVLLNDSKVEVRGQNPQNSNVKKPIKSIKVLQTLQFLVKSCVLERSCWNLT